MCASAQIRRTHDVSCPPPATHPAGRPEPPHATVTAVTEGAPVFDQPGIDLDHDLAWIHRDQYVYLIEIAHALGNPDDWASFRDDLAEALAAHDGMGA